MARWGNALGGWRKQKRARNGQFGSGVSKYAKARRRAVKSNRKAGPASGNYSRELSRRNQYDKHSYSKPGGYYRRNRDQLLSQGAYSNTSAGKLRNRSGRARNVAAVVGRNAGISLTAAGPINQAALGVSYARHRQYTSSAKNRNAYTLTSSAKRTAQQKKTRRRVIAGVAVVGAVGAASYVAYTRHQDKKFDALPGITLYHNNDDNVMRKGFRVSSRISNAYDADFVFFSNTKGGRARIFGKKEYKVKYNGPLAMNASWGSGDAIAKNIKSTPNSKLTGLGVMRDYADENNVLGQGLSRRGEQFVMISRADLAGNVTVQRSRSFDRRKRRTNFNNFATAEQKTHSRERYGAHNIMHKVQQSHKEVIAERGVYDLVRRTHGQQAMMKRLKRAKTKESLKGRTRAARVAKARKKATTSKKASTKKASTRKTTKKSSRKKR